MICSASHVDIARTHTARCGAPFSEVSSAAKRRQRSRHRTLGQVFSRSTQHQKSPTQSRPHPPSTMHRISSPILTKGRCTSAESPTPGDTIGNRRRRFHRHGCPPTAQPPSTEPRSLTPITESQVEIPDPHATAHQIHRPPSAHQRLQGGTCSATQPNCAGPAPQPHHQNG